MTAPFDIFKKEPDGSVLWRGSANSLEEARARANELAVRSLREHIILDQMTGNKVVVDPGRTNGAGAPDWKKLCLEALSESNATSLPKKVAAAQRAIAKRLRGLGPLPGGDAEKIALRDAARALGVVIGKRSGTVAVQAKPANDSVSAGA